MDKNAIKKYAVWARRELISRVSQRAALYEITDKGYGDASADSVLGRVMSAEEKRQRQALIAQIREKGYEQVMEEIAYTWFNRFIALRFMEVNGYLPSRVRVFTDDENNFKPQILAEAINMELDGLDMEKVYALKNANDDDALFKYMIIVQCNALSSILPGMFQRISDFTELLFPDNLLREGSVIEQMVTMIPEEDWTDQVQIIGWLYQYYNTEPKDKVFAGLKKNIKISKENIPAATQLFTPDWIVRYMVENSLGRLWLEGHPNDELKASWKYYLDEAEQEPEVQVQLSSIQKEYAALKPEDILAIDPCQGSGHILAYMFDVLVQIYESYGYTAREAAASIVEHNIWGLDIDDRATQLAYFSVMMKARQYDRRFFSRGIQPHVLSIQDSNGIDQHCVEYFVHGQESVRKPFEIIQKGLLDAKEYGSLVKIEPCDFRVLHGRLDEIASEITPSILSLQVLERVKPVIETAKALSQKYHVVCTNPPYMGSTGMGAKLSKFVKEFFPDTKGDLFAAFIERGHAMLKHNGVQGMITQHAWMFLSSYEKLRTKICKHQVLSMMHLGARAFDEIGGEVVQTTSFVLRNHDAISNYMGTYIRLIAGNSEAEKQHMFSQNNLRFSQNTDNFKKIPGSPFAYWVSPAVYSCYEKGRKMSSLVHGFQGMITGDNDYYLRLWHELKFADITLDARQSSLLDPNYKTWVPYKKGGGACRWFGNDYYALRWENAGKGLTRARTENSGYYLKEGVTWSYISTNTFSANYYPCGYLWDVHGSSIFAGKHEDLLYYIALMNSVVGNYLLSLSNPTLSFQVENILALPVIVDEHEFSAIVELAERAISLSKNSWDHDEISWNFRRHMFIGDYSSIEDASRDWSEVSYNEHQELREIEEQLNKKFISIYGFQGILDYTVDPSNVNYKVANKREDVVAFLSYAVGCMLGRYSLSTDGISFAGGDWCQEKYKIFVPDRDGIIPLCDDEYFEDDVVGYLVKFVETVYGTDTLEANLKYISEALGGKGSSREVIRNYFINDFYADHLKIYQKRPIYWLFDSGKKNGFKCLIYMHRYQPDTIARIRTDYVHEQQSRYRTAIADLESRIANAGTGERVKLSKQLTKLQEQAEELRVYEEKIHHLADQMIRIDLDDGVKHNYAIFQDVLAKIK
jgi:hypothetical protein